MAVLVWGGEKASNGIAAVKVWKAQGRWDPGVQGPILVCPKALQAIREV